MGILDMFKKSETKRSDVPYSVRTTFLPVRLGAHKIESSDMCIFVKNLTADPILTSVVVSVPRALSVDRNGIPKAKEVRLDFLQSGEEKEISVPIWSNVTTDVGTYPVQIKVIAHYRSYSYVLNSVRINSNLRAV